MNKEAPLLAELPTVADVDPASLAGLPTELKWAIYSRLLLS
jgi:hypothetical protein